MTKKQIDYYGDTDNYIHLKWGDCVKAYNFTDDFTEKYPLFASEYRKYWEGGIHRQFKNPFQIVNYVYENNIPIHFYYNFTDMPAKSQKEIIKYLLENSKISLS